MAWLPNTGISCPPPCLLLSFVIYTHTHMYLADNGALPTPCHVSGFSFMKIYSCGKGKDAFTMEYFTLGCTASLWFLYSPTILLLGVGCNKILKTKLRCGHPSLCFSLLYTYICICRKLHCGRTDPNVKLNARQGQLGGAALCNDLGRRRAPVGCSIQLFPVLETLSRKKAARILPNFWGGCFYHRVAESSIYTWL